jgi:type IV secretion system protein VirB9
MGRMSRVGSVAGLMLALTVTALPSFVLAEATPSRGRHDDRVRVAAYVDGEVYRINTTLLNVTTVEFAPGETISSVVAGDTEGFQLDGVPGGRAFAIKPVLAGVRTNVTVYTNQRSYYFNVVEVDEPTYFVIRFSYPATAQAAPRNVVARTAPNYRYGLAGPTEFSPRSVWDDGTFTYFEFSPNVPVPAILRVGADGAERTVNSAAQGNGVVRVSGVSSRWVLRLGDEVTCVEALPPEAVS